MCSYRQLLVWRHTHALANEIYRATHRCSWENQLDLAAEMREAALAIPVHIATHYSYHAATFLHGLERARRVLVRLEHLVDLAGQLHYWPVSRVGRITRQLARTRGQLTALCHSLAPHTAHRSVAAERS